MKKVIIELSKKDYDDLVNELRSLYGYHWNDDHIHADDCGSKVIDTVEKSMKEI